MRTLVATEPGTVGADNEDVAMVGQDIFIVADGLTARTETGCIHGVAWFAHELVRAVARNAKLGPQSALVAAIRDTAALHSDSCDLTHSATPCAAVAVVELNNERLEYVILGDVTVVVDTGRVAAISDVRITQTARAERDTADAIPASAPNKAEALLKMKRAELAVRNKDGGYWIAGADPAAVDHAIAGSFPRSAVRRFAILSDGAARVVELFNLYEWPTTLDLLAEQGPDGLIRQLRQVEHADADTTRWPRNKVSDDAAVVYCDQLERP